MNLPFSPFSFSISIPLPSIFGGGQLTDTFGSGHDIFICCWVSFCRPIVADVPSMPPMSNGNIDLVSSVCSMVLSVRVIVVLIVHVNVLADFNA